MITEHVLNKFDHNQAPLHELELKVDHICILLSSFDKEQGLTEITRVRIAHIQIALLDLLL